jgi:hypothetical protein
MRRPQRAIHRALSPSRRADCRNYLQHAVWVSIYVVQAFVRVRELAAMVSWAGGSMG